MPGLRAGAPATLRVVLTGPARDVRARLVSASFDDVAALSKSDQCDRVARGRALEHGPEHQQRVRGPDIATLEAQVVLQRVLGDTGRLRNRAGKSIRAVHDEVTQILRILKETLG